MCLVCLLLCKEEGASGVFAITKRRDMGLYDVPLSMSLLGFGMWTMLANLHTCVIMLVLRAVFFNMLVRNTSSRGSNDLSLHEVELSGNNRCQQIEINSYPDSPLFISKGFLPRVSSKRLN